FTAKEAKKASHAQGCNERGTDVCIRVGMAVGLPFQYSAMMASGMETGPTDSYRQNLEAAETRRGQPPTPTSRHIVISRASQNTSNSTRSRAQKVPIISVSRIRSAIMYSRTRTVIDFELAMMQNGSTAVVRITNGSEMRSPPMW